MTNEQIKDYLKKYRIDSEEQLAKHIEQLKRNTKPNNEIIFSLVEMLVNEKSVLNSFFAKNKKQEMFTRTVTPFFLDEVIHSTRHKAREEGKFHKDDVITNSSRGEKETMGYLQGVKESQSTEKAPIFTYCKVNKNALEALSLRALYGHKKYKETDQDWQNFTRVPNALEEYANASFRHALGIGEEDEETHLVAEAWNAVAKLEVFLRNKLNKS